MADLQLGPVVPILRIFDEAKAREFYIGYLGFSLDWEHRFGANFPLYMQVSRGGCALHLSEHHGDCCPGAAVRIAISDIDGFHAEITGKGYKYLRPGIEDTPWGAREVRLLAPFGNKVVLVSQPTAA